MFGGVFGLLSVACQLLHCKVEYSGHSWHQVGLTFGHCVSACMCHGPDRLPKQGPYKVHTDHTWRNAILAILNRYASRLILAGKIGHLAHPSSVVKTATLPKFTPYASTGAEISKFEMCEKSYINYHVKSGPVTGGLCCFGPLTFPAFY